MNDVSNAPWYAVFTSVLQPDFKKTFQAGQRGLDMRSMAHIALALKLWKNTHNGYPKSLTELKSVPIASLHNALSRKTIGYKTQGDNFLLYSFGINRRDDGGKWGRHDPLDLKVRVVAEDADDLSWQQSLGVKKKNN